MKKRKAKPAIAITDAIPEVPEEDVETVKKVRKGPRQPHEIVDRDFIHW